MTSNGGARYLKRFGCGIGLLLVTAVSSPAGSTWTMMNPTGRDYRDELVRLKLEVPADISRELYRVTEDGREVPYQVENVDGQPSIWVCTDLGKDQTHAYAVVKGPAATSKPRVTVHPDDGTWVLDNGLMAIRLPQETDAGLRPPILQVRLPDGRWVGQGQWLTERKLQRFASTVIGDGTVFAKVRLRYEFEGTGGLFAAEPAVFQVTITLAPGRHHAVIEEAFALGRADRWVFDCAAGWDARGAMVEPHFGGFGRPTMTDAHGIPFAFPPQTLQVGQTRMHDVLINLVPRWSQAYDDGWFFAATDNKQALGALVCRAGQWLWPYDSMIEVKVRESGDFAGLVCPLWRGKRYWYLVDGDRSLWDQRARDQYVMRHAVEGLDKLYQEYILDWPGLAVPEGAKWEADEAARWASGAGRFVGRDKPFPGWGPGAAQWKISDHPISLLTAVQAMFDPDTYGNHWLYFSPENPNFFSSWVGMMTSSVHKLAAHPQYEAIRQLAIQKVREELYFGATLPGGAGQECFGYMARRSWARHSGYCRDKLGADISDWTRVQAGNAFIFRSSFPLANGLRRTNPGGDTHPPGPDPVEAARAAGIEPDASALRTEEFPGFGVVFRHRAGTPRETYLSFKSGPNRGHYHGDQLAFHYAANGAPVLVDHHCSYNPRAGQEHMHNRVAFHTDALPWANMDGYERLIAFQTSAAVDVAIGQVESERLRVTEPVPPEKWDTSLPQVMLQPNLAYRRTVVFLKRDDADIIVLRDQFAGPPLKATYCLHGYGAAIRQEGNTFDFDGVRLHVIEPARYAVTHHDWQHENGGLEQTRGLRLTTEGDHGEFITVLVPRPRRLTPVLRLDLENALAKVVGDRKSKDKTLQWLDARIVLNRVDGKWQTDSVTFLADDFDIKARFEGTFQVEETERGITIDLQAKVSGRRGLPAVPIQYRIELERDGQSYRGSYTGRFHELDCRGSVRGEEVAAGVSNLLLYADPASWPEVKRVPGGVQIDQTKVLFAGGIDDLDAMEYVRVDSAGQLLLRLTGAEIDLDRSQGDIGLFVPDAGYPFGVLPDWLLRQRTHRPPWYREVWPPTRAPVVKP